MNGIDELGEQETRGEVKYDNKPNDENREGIF